MKDSTKWGLIGYGKFAKKIENSFFHTKYSELHSIASKSFDKNLKNFSELENKKKLYDSYDTLINDKSIDCVYIATTNNFHKNLIISSAKNKKNIICEKPACLSEIDFLECIDQIKKNDVFFMEGLMYLHHPQILKAIELVKADKIGKIKKINASFGFKVGKKFLFFELKKIDPKSRLFNPELGGGAINDLSCYPITAALLFFNINEDDNKIILHEFKRNDGKYGVDENAEAKLHFKNGGTANLKVSIRKNLDNIIEIIGTKGTIKIPYPWKAPVESYIEVIINQNKMLINTSLKQDIYSLEIDNASRAIIQNQKEINFPGIDLDRSLEYIKIMNKWKK